MRKKRFLIAILMVLLTSLSSTCWAFYDWRVPAFSIDKAWQFDSTFVRNPPGNANAAQMSLDNTSFVDFPGQIAWVVATKSNPQLNRRLQYCQVYLIDEYSPGKSKHMFLVDISFDGHQNWGLPSITNFSGCVTAQTNSKIFTFGEVYYYFHTRYSEQVRNFIAEAGGNLNLNIVFGWFNGNQYEETDMEAPWFPINAADRTLISANLPQANPTDAHWTVHDSTTCVAFKPGVNQSPNTKLRVVEWYNNNIETVYDSFSSDSLCYYHPFYLTPTSSPTTTANINNSSFACA